VAYSSQGTVNPLLITGTYNKILIDNRTFLDRCYGALKLRPQQITGEMLQIGLDIMNLTQLDMLNDTAPLWTIGKHVIALVQGQSQYVLPPNTNDVQSAFYRTMSNLTSSSTITQSTASYQWYFPAGATAVDTISLNWPSSSFPIQVQTAPDGANWTTVYSSGATTLGLTGNVPYDIDNANSAIYWRVIPATTLNGLPISPANTLPITLSGQVYNTPADILMSRLNKDDYWNLTNKKIQGRPLQWWMDRKLDPQMDVWQVPDATAAQNFMVVWRQRMIADPGSLQNTIEFPPRWYLPFLYKVAAELAFCTPEVDPSVTSQITSKADLMYRRALSEERDKSPVKFQTNIGVYTK